MVAKIDLFDVKRLGVFDMAQQNCNFRAFYCSSTKAVPLLLLK